MEKTQNSSDVALVLSTTRSDVNATFKIGRCLQIRYEDVRIVVHGICKSVGTILAIAANELVFSSC